jgi:hypothetical protein
VIEGQRNGPLVSSPNSAPSAPAYTTPEYTIMKLNRGWISRQTEGTLLVTKIIALGVRVVTNPFETFREAVFVLFESHVSKMNIKSGGRYTSSYCVHRPIIVVCTRSSACVGHQENGAELACLVGVDNQ